MATTDRQQRQRRSLRSLYPPEHAKRVAREKARDPYYLDDTLDAHPPYHIFDGPSTPEEIAAARAKAKERGLLPPGRPEQPAEHRSAANGAGRNGRGPAKGSGGRT